MKLPRNEIKKIAVFRALQLGDLLCSIPAIRALHMAYPDAEITLLGLPWAQSLINRFPKYFHCFKHFPGYPGLPEQTFHPKTFTQFLSEVQEENYDLVLQMQGNGSIVNPMVELFGAKHTAGFCLPDDYCPNKELFLTYPAGIHEIHRHLALLNCLGIKATDDALEFPLYKKDEDELKALNLPLQPQRYVCVHAGSRGAWRQWPTEYFAQLAAEYAAQGLTVVLTGTKEELPIVEEVQRHLKEEPIIVAGKTSLGAMSVLLRDAALLISNCTGVSHIAAAVKTPGIVISMDGEPERWAPLNQDLHPTIDWTKTPDFHLALAALRKLIGRQQRHNHRHEGIIAIK